MHLGSAIYEVIQSVDRIRDLSPDLHRQLKVRLIRDFTGEAAALYQELNQDDIPAPELHEWETFIRSITHDPRTVGHALFRALESNEYPGATGARAAPQGGEPSTPGECPAEIAAGPASVIETEFQTDLYWARRIEYNDKAREERARSGTYGGPDPGEAGADDGAALDREIPDRTSGREESRTGGGPVRAGDVPRVDHPVRPGQHRSDDLGRGREPSAIGRGRGPAGPDVRLDLPREPGDRGTMVGPGGSRSVLRSGPSVDVLPRRGDIRGDSSLRILVTEGVEQEIGPGPMLAELGSVPFDASRWITVDLDAERAGELKGAGLPGGPGPEKVSRWIRHQLWVTGFVVLETEYRYSPSMDGGVHLRVKVIRHGGLSLTGSEVMAVRKLLGDDPRRWALDLSRGRQNVHYLSGHLWDRKGPNELEQRGNRRVHAPKLAGEWIAVKVS